MHASCDRRCINAASNRSDGIEAIETEWRIGAAATLTQIEEKMAEEFPALGDMLRGARAQERDAAQNK